MSKLEELERDLKVAYLNYENDDLNETLKYLDRMINNILKNDESLNNDPFWKNISIDIFKAVILNNFYNKKEMTGNDLDSLLANEEEMEKNIKEFCNNFKGNSSIDFISHIENITDKPLKSVIEIIMVNIGKMNIANIKSPEDKNTIKEESKVQKIDCFCGKSFEFDWSKIPNTEKFIYVRCPYCDSERKLKNMFYNSEPTKDTDNENSASIDKMPLITQDDVIEVIDNQKLITTIYDIKNNIENILSKENISYFKDGKEIQEERIIFSFSVIDNSENSITIKTTPMCEVMNGKINLNNPKTEFKLYKNQVLTLATPTMDCGYTYKISIKKRKIANSNELIDTAENHRNNETFSPDELKEIMNHIHGNKHDNTKNNEFNLVLDVENIFEIWEEIKNFNLELKDFFEETEKEAINELIYAKDKATIKGKKLSEYLKDNNATCSDKNIQSIISYFGFQSLYDMKFTNDGNLPCEEISVDNVGLFRAVLMINIIAKLDSIVSIGLPLNIKFTFEKKEFAEILSPMLNYYLPKIFKNIKEIKIFYKQG